jgi:hypothetical protein
LIIFLNDQTEVKGIAMQVVYGQEWNTTQLAPSATKDTPEYGNITDTIRALRHESGKNNHSDRNNGGNDSKFI